MRTVVTGGDLHVEGVEKNLVLFGNLVMSVLALIAGATHLVHGVREFLKRRSMSGFGGTARRHHATRRRTRSAEVPKGDQLRLGAVAAPLNGSVC